MMPNKRKSTNHYAGKPYTQIPDGLWLCPEFNALKPHSRCLYFLMLAKWDWAHPKKPFVLTYDEASKITGFDRRRISICLKDLMKGGFIEIPKKGSFPHNISMYQLNPDWIKKEYPKKPAPLPEYLAQFLKKPNAV